MELSEKSLKTILEGQREEYQRYLGVVVEDFKSQIQLVAESMSGMQRQLSIIRDMVVKNTEDIEIMKMDLHIIKGDLKEKVDRYELKALERRIEILEKKR